MAAGLFRRHAAEEIQAQPDVSTRADLRWPAERAQLLCHSAAWNFPDKLRADRTSILLQLQWATGYSHVTALRQDSSSMCSPVDFRHLEIFCSGVPQRCSLDVWHMGR